MTAWSGLEDKPSPEEREQQRLMKEILYAQRRASKAWITAVACIILLIAVTIFVAKELLFIPDWLLIFGCALPLFYLGRSFLAYGERNAYQREFNKNFSKLYEEAALKD